MLLAACADLEIYKFRWAPPDLLQTPPNHVYSAGNNWQAIKLPRQRNPHGWRTTEEPPGWPICHTSSSWRESEQKRLSFPLQSFYFTYPVHQQEQELQPWSLSPESVVFSACNIVLLLRFLWSLTTLHGTASLGRPLVGWLRFGSHFCSSTVRLAHTDLRG